MAIIYLVGFPVLGLHGGAALTRRGCRGISSCPVLPPSSCGGAMTVLPPRAAGKPGFALPLQPQPVIAREEGPPQDMEHSSGEKQVSTLVKGKHPSTGICIICLGGHCLMELRSWDWRGGFLVRFFFFFFPRANACSFIGNLLVLFLTCKSTCLPRRFSPFPIYPNWAIEKYCFYP